MLYAREVPRAIAFWERLGFELWYSFPTDGEPGYANLRRDGHFVAITASSWPEQQYGVQMGSGPRVEMFVYVGDVDVTVAALRGEGVVILREPEDMPWGERVATVQDPDGNPVTLATDAGT